MDQRIDKWLNMHQVKHSKIFMVEWWWVCNVILSMLEIFHIRILKKRTLLVNIMLNGDILKIFFLTAFLTWGDFVSQVIFGNV